VPGVQAAGEGVGEAVGEAVGGLASSGAAAATAAKAMMTAGVNFMIAVAFEMVNESM